MIQKNSSFPYFAPECCVVAFNTELFCSSPEDGGLEGTGDEDWVI